MKNPLLAGSALSRRQFITYAGAATAALSVPAAAKAASNTTAAPSYPGIEGVDLDLLMWDGGAFMDQMLPVLQEKWTGLGGGKLNYRRIPATDVDRAIRAVNQAGPGEDILFNTGTNVVTYQSLGLIEPVTDLFQDDMDDFFPSVRDTGTINGEFYGPQSNENGQTLYYDRKLLDRYGVKPPETLDTAWTWTEALEIFQELQKAERGRRGTDQFWALFSGAGLYATSTSGIYPRSAATKGSNGWKLVSDDGKTATGYLNDPDAIAGLQLMQDIHHKYGIAPISNQIDMFYNDQVAFLQGFPVYYELIMKSRPDIELGTTPMPYIKTPLVHSGAVAWMLNKQSTKMEAARQFIKYVGSSEGNDIVSRAWTSLPIRKSMLAGRPEFQTKPLKLFADAVEHWAVPRPKIPGFSEFETVWIQLASDIINGGDVKSLADTACARLDSQLRRYG